MKDEFDLLQVLHAYKCFMSQDIRKNYNIYRNMKLFVWGYSSGVEHSTADREVHGSTPCVP